MYEIIAWKRSHVDYKVVGFESPIPIRGYLGQPFLLKDISGGIRKLPELQRTDARKCEAQ